MQTILARFQFSNYSRRHMVPNILAQGRFTKKGFKVLGSNRIDSRNFVERRLAKILRPVDLTNVQNAHLYYNHPDEIQKRIVNLQQKRRTRQQLLKEAPTIDYILNIIKDRQNLETGSWKLLFGLKLLHKHYESELQSNQEHILYALKRLNQYLIFLDIHNFRSLVSFGQKYFAKDQEVWKLYLKNTVRFILSYEQRQIPLLSKDVKDDVRKDFLLIFHAVVEKTLQMQFPLDGLIEQLDMMLRNHFRDIRGLTQPPSHNDFSNLKADEAAIFFSDFAKVMILRKDFYNEYDEKIKIKQIQDILQGAQKSFKTSGLSPKAQRSLNQAYEKLKSSPYKLSSV